MTIADRVASRWIKALDLDTPPPGFDQEEWEDMDEYERGEELTKLTPKQIDAHDKIQAWVKKTRFKSLGDAKRWFLEYTHWMEMSEVLKDPEYNIPIGFEMYAPGFFDDGGSSLQVTRDQAVFIEDVQLGEGTIFDLSSGPAKLLSHLENRYKAFQARVKLFNAAIKGLKADTRELWLNNNTAIALDEWDPGKDPTPFLRGLLKDLKADPAKLPELIKIVKQVR